MIGVGGGLFIGGAVVALAALAVRYGGETKRVNDVLNGFSDADSRTASLATDVGVAAARNNSGGGQSCKQAAAGEAYSTTQLTSPSIAPTGRGAN